MSDHPDPEPRYNPGCPDCHGTGRRENPYAHHCDGPLCVGADQTTVECECGDDAVDGPAPYRPGVVIG